MKQLQNAISQMISISEREMKSLLVGCFPKTLKKNQIVSSPGKVAEEVYFINKGIIRLIVIDNKGNENTTHFALENQFIADYASFLQKTNSIYTLQAMEETEIVVMPRKSIEWGYKNLNEGDKLGRIIAEYYFIYLDNRLKNVYGNNPKERYDNITQIFPNIHNRVPQTLIKIKT